MVLVGDWLFRYSPSISKAAGKIQDQISVGLPGIDHVDSMADLPGTGFLRRELESD